MAIHTIPMQLHKKPKRHIRFRLRSAMAVVTFAAVVLAACGSYDRTRFRTEHIRHSNISTDANSRYRLYAQWAGSKSNGMELVAAVAVLTPTSELSSSIGRASLAPPPTIVLHLSGVFLMGRRSTLQARTRYTPLSTCTSPKRVKGDLD